MSNPIKVIKLTGVSGSLDGKADVDHDHVLADITDAGTAAASDTTAFATASQGTKADTAIQAGTLASVNADISDATLIDTTDPRLSDARTPTTHSHTLSDITDSGTSAGLDVATVGNAAVSEVVKGNDSRLSDDRDPTAHTHTLSEISDSGSAAASATTDFATAAQGTLADTALQDASAFATAAQGTLADTALQDASAFATAAQGTLADTALQNASAFAAASHTHTLSDLTDNSVVTRNDQTSVSGNAWVINDDTMATASQQKVASSISTKNYIDSLTGGSSMAFRGDYDATTNTPDLDGSAPREPVVSGDTYIISADGLFWTEEVTTGTLLIANQDDPNGLNGWDIVAGGGGDITTDDLWAAAGDLVYATGTAAATGLTIGNESDVLTVSSGLPVWSPPAGGGGLANIVEDTTPELGGDLLVGTNSFTVSGNYGDLPVLGISNSGSSYADDFSIQIKSGSSYGDSPTIEVLDQSGSGYYSGDLVLQSFSSSYGGAGKIQLDNYIFNSNESLTGKTGQVLTYNGTDIALAAGGSPDNTAYGASWNGNLDAASKNAIYDKIETIGGDITTDPAFDALGDLIVGSGSNTSSRLPVGSTDQVLTVVGGTATWATASGGGTQQGTGSTYYNIIPASEPFRVRDQAGEYSVDLQTQGNSDDVAAGTYSVLIGGRYNSAAGSYSSVIGGNSNTISSQGSKSTILASSSSSVTYSNSAVIAHSGNVSTTTLSTYNSAVIAGTQNTLDGFMGGGYAAIIGGNSNSGYYADKSVILGGNDNSGRFVNSSVILGGNNNELEYNTGCVIGGTRVKSIGVALGRLDGVFAYADDTAADYTITQEKTANFRVANGMHITAPLFIDERASALADIAGRGQIWVKTATPNELWFTDDAGSDRPISEGVYTVATLPTGVAGRRAFVSDSGNTLASHHGQVLANGGANFVPVYHDGSNWRVG